MLVAPKTQNKLFTKVSKEVLLGPSGIICIPLALLLEISDWFLDFFHVIFPGSWETIAGPVKTALDLGYAFLSAILLKVPLLSNLLPFLIERAPFLSTILPTWLIRILL